MDISVIIPTYNRYETLKRALTSVYAQIHMPKEVIIIDDGSSDATYKIQEQFPHAKYIFQINRGVSSARNKGIKESTSPWIAFLDSDDTWEIQKLAWHVEFHKQNPQILMSYTDERWFRNQNEVKLPKKYQKYDGNIFEKCLSHCIIAPSATLIHKDLLNKVGLFDESLEVCEDYDLWLRVACANEIGLIDKKLINKYGGDEDQLSVKHWGMDRFRVRALEKLLDGSINVQSSQINLIRAALAEKYTLLLKGAVKYDRLSQALEYKSKIEIYNK